MNPLEGLVLKAYLLAIIFLIAGCQKAPGPKNQHVVHFNIGCEPQTLDPRKARSLNDINIVKLFFQGLTRINSNDQPELAAAETYTVSEDGTLYTFKLRPHQWSNGDWVKAHDFVNTWQTTLAPDFPTDNVFQLYIIKNAKAVKEGRLPLSELGIQALDTQTLTIELEHPVPYLFELLSRPIFYPLHPSEDTTISNGPFYLSAWQHQDHLCAEKNAYYWDRDSMHLSGLKMVIVSEDTALKMFENKELDWIGSPFSIIPTDAIPYLKEKKQLNISPFSGTAWIRINTQHKPFDNPNIRKAFAYALDRQALVTHVTQGSQIPSTGIVPQNFWKTQPHHFADANLESARQLISAIAPITNTITLLYAAGERNHKMAQTLQSQWKEVLGITVELEAVETKVYFSRISNQDYQLSIGSWIADFADPINFLDVFKTKSVGTNNTHWENTVYEQLLDQSNQTLDVTQRQALLCKAEEILISEMPVIPLFTYSLLYVKNPKLKNVTISSMGSLDFTHAHLEE